MQCECPTCPSCKPDCEGTCGDRDSDGICGCDCAQTGAIRTEFGMLCADCYDFYAAEDWFSGDMVQ